MNSNSKRCDWVELHDSLSGRCMFANIITGECVWDEAPINTEIKRAHDNQWWELYDHSTGYFYYYNTATRASSWTKPPAGTDTISLARIQKINTKFQLIGKSSIDLCNGTTASGTQSHRKHSTQQVVAGTDGEEAVHTTVNSLMHNYKSRLVKDDQPSCHYMPTAANHISNQNFARNSSLRRSATFIHPSKSVLPVNSAARKQNCAPHCRRTGKLVSENLSGPSSRARVANTNATLLTTLPNILDHESVGTSGANRACVVSDEENDDTGCWSFSQMSVSPHSPGAFNNSSRHDDGVRSSASSGGSCVTHHSSVDSGTRVQQKLALSCRSQHTSTSVRPQHVSDESSAPTFTHFDSSTNQLLSNSLDSLNDSLTSSLDLLADFKLVLDTDTLDGDGCVFSDDYPSDTNETGAISLNVYDISSSCTDLTTRHRTIDNIYKDKRMRRSICSDNVLDLPLPPRRNESIQYRQRLISINENGTGHLHDKVFGSRPHNGISAGQLEEANFDEFVRRHVRPHRRRMFGKRVSLSEMCKWTKSPLRRPMLHSLDRTLHKSACSCFTLIQLYMGDRSAASCSVPPLTRRPHWAASLIALAVRHPPLCDEILLQLCRQTNDTPHLSGLTRGWELLCVCLCYFLPVDQAFRASFVAYIGQHCLLDSDTSVVDMRIKCVKMLAHYRISLYSQFCMRRLQIGHICNMGVVLQNHNLFMQDILLAKREIFEGSFFGPTLDEIMVTQKPRYPNYNIPWVMVFLTKLVISAGGSFTEGIFRISADNEAVHRLRIEMERGMVISAQECDPHVPAALLRLWLRKLWKPLISDHVYHLIVRSVLDDVPDISGTTGTAASSGDKAVASRLVSLLQSSLPDISMKVLTYLVNFLQSFAHESVVQHTKMSEYNLATVFAPNIFRLAASDSDGGVDSMSMLEHASRHTTCLNILIKHMSTSNVKSIQSF